MKCRLFTKALNQWPQVQVDKLVVKRTSLILWCLSELFQLYCMLPLFTSFTTSTDYVPFHASERYHSCVQFDDKCWKCHEPVCIGSDCLSVGMVPQS